MRQKVLVTGATGFIGKYIVERLLDRGFELRCLVRESSNTQELLSNHKVELFTGDLTDAETLTGIATDIDYVIHLAAMGHVSSVTQEAYNKFVGINETGTKNLIAEFLGSPTLKRFIHFSSTAAMGPIGLPILNEKSIPNPVTPYQKSKLRSEKVVLDAIQNSGLPAIILRPCMVYGIGGIGEFHKFYCLMKKGRFPKVGFGANLTPMVHVTDVADAAVLALDHGKDGELFIIAAETSYKLDDIRNAVIKTLNVHPAYPFIPAFLALIGAKMLEKLYVLRGKEPVVTYRNIKSTITDRTFDIKKAKCELGYSPKVGAESGIPETVLWYQKNVL